MKNLRKRIEKKIIFVENITLRIQLDYIYVAIKDRNYQEVIETIILNGFVAIIDKCFDKKSNYLAIDFFEPLLTDTFTAEAKNYHLKKYSEI